MVSKVQFFLAVALSLLLASCTGGGGLGFDPGPTGDDITISDVTHTTMVSGESCTFHVNTFSIYGSVPSTYSWDFGGGATPNTSSASNPVVLLGAAGAYMGKIEVWTATGYAYQNFAYTITTGAGGGNQPPVAILTVNPPSGHGITELSFDASTSYDPDGSISQIEWDMDGNGTFESGNADSVHLVQDFTPFETKTVGIRVTDNEGATDTATATFTAT